MTDTPSATPPVPATWRVVSQQETSGQAANGQFVDGVQVAAQLQDGTTFSVFVPMSAYNPDTVKSMLAAKAAQVAAVSNLAG